MENFLTYDDTSAEQSASKVSISARLVPALIYLIPLIGAASSAYFIMRMMIALSEAKGVGADVVFASLAESIFPVLGSLYLQILLSIAIFVILIIRMKKQSKTATPSSWFFLVSGLLCLIPLITLFESQSMIIEVLITPDITDVAAIGSTISLLIIFIIVALPIAFVILLVLSVIPLSTKKSPGWSPLITATLIQILYIALAIAYQLRYLWVYNAAT